MSLRPYLSTAWRDGHLLSGLTGLVLHHTQTCAHGRKQTASSLCPPAPFCYKSSQITLPSKSPVWTAVWALSLVQSHGFLPSSHLSGALGRFNGGGKGGEGEDSIQPAGSSTCLPASPCQTLRLSLSSAPLPLSQDSQQVSPQNGDLSEPPWRSNSSRHIWLLWETERSHISTQIHGALFPQTCRKSHRSDSLLNVWLINIHKIA